MSIKLSTHPEDPRVFSQAKIWVPLGLILSFLTMLLLMGLFRRFGVDRDKAWTRFDKLFNRQIRFQNVDRFDMGVGRFKIYVEGTMINIDFKRFNYSLVYIRILEELNRLQSLVQRPKTYAV